MNVRTFAIIIVLASVRAPAQAQSPESSFSFEVASVKRAAPDDGLGMTRVEGGLGTADPAHVTYTNISLMNLLGRAYPEPYRIDGPSWLDMERYDVVASIPSGTTKDQFAAMLQNLLSERFGVKAHHERRDFSGYNLVIAKSGLKLGESAAEAAAQTPDGFPKLDKPGMVTANAITSGGLPVARLTAKAQPISKLVLVLSGATKVPVQDKTGLTGVYDFSLEYAPRGGMSATSPSTNDAEIEAPDITYSIKSLGLALERTSVNLDVLVVEHAEKSPTAN